MTKLNEYTHIMCNNVLLVLRLLVKGGVVDGSFKFKNQIFDKEASIYYITQFFCQTITECYGVHVVACFHSFKVFPIVCFVFWVTFL